MRSNTYMDRALRARDPRYARVLERLGYQRSDMQAAKPVEPVDEMAELRAEYERVIGRQPFMGWDAATLRQKIAAHRAEG